MSEKIKFFLDTEFMENGRKHPLELLSIGIVCENGESLYLENFEANLDNANNWVKQNVFPHLYMTTDGRNQPFDPKLHSIEIVGNLITEFVSLNALYHNKKPEFWGYFCDYDWVIFCQIFGRMIDLPKGFPFYCNDLKQLMKWYDINESLDELTKTKSNHNALEDAKQIKHGYYIVMNRIGLPNHPSLLQMQRQT